MVVIHFSTILKLEKHMGCVYNSPTPFTTSTHASYHNMYRFPLLGSGSPSGIM